MRQMILQLQPGHARHLHIQYQTPCFGYQ
jgi:hypothetical protein